jgi:hypothetical protein
MKRFLLFAGELYYPCGGWRDFIDSFDTLAEAEAKADKLLKIPPGNPNDDAEDYIDWYEIVDTSQMQVKVESTVGRNHISRKQ